MPKTYTFESEMLTLAAITYRGFDLPLPESMKRPVMYRAMKQCLDTLGPVKNKWEIIWGPVSHPDGRLKIDDAAMFVARGLGDENKNRLVIAVRGTNPISLTDWISGDFTVTQMKPWPYCAASGKVSVSTMYGLGLLQSFHAEPQGAATTNNALVSPAAGIAKTLIDRALQLLHPSSHTAAVVPIVNEARNKEAGGVTLIEFLKAQIDERQANGLPKLEIYVTGHSKGGTLSSTLALWLADTQGSGTDDWSRKDQAEITAYSFAGPTAGDSTFASHSDDVLGQRCHRVYSEIDIAPMAWTTGGLANILTLYPRDPWLAGLINPVAAAVASCDYKQIGAGKPLTPAPLKDESKPLLWQIVYQHLDGYLQQMDLLDEMSAVGTFLNPVPI